MTIATSVTTALFLMAVVFLVLFCLYFCIRGFSYAMGKLEGALRKNNN